MGCSSLLDITLWHGEEEIEPTGSVTVTFSGIDTEGLYPKVYHIDTNAQTATDMEAEKTETGDVAVATDHFSMYDISLVADRGLSGTIGQDTFKDGGEFRLTDDAWTADNGSSAILSITQNTTIDLNGHTLKISKANQFFDVHEGAKLTIMDSKAPQETVSGASGDIYGNKATLENDTLTYYITESTPNDTGTGTRETLKQHTVPLAGAGKILCQEASDQAILVKGTLELQSGVLQNTGGNHIVLVDRGTLDINGGYIVGGGSGDKPGGGIYVDNGTVNIRGGVIAANRGRSGGGIFFQNGTLNISGGAVTGNWLNDGHDNGGGIFVQNGTLNLSDGYVTNNYKACDCDDCKNDVNNKHGGGGIALANSSVMNMTGGYVTGNYSGLAGGGIYAGFYGNNVSFTMSGGTIASNCAELGEGGSLRIAGGTDGVIQATNKVYITNNITNTNNDWGGGGIFVQDKGNLNITNALITDNTAGGYGGGVAACPTGETLITHTDGAAIYKNSDSGKNMSGRGNGKNADSEIAQKNDTFTSNGHKDYFCVRNGGNDPISLVTGGMLGDGAANWTGSSDGTYITISKTGYATANYLFGLAADPDSEAIAAAENAARVIITGNRSNIHGGGIMTNGGLILGRKDKIVTATPELDIIGTKALLKDGIAQDSGRDFTFQLANDEKVLGTATSDPVTGQFTISPGVAYSETGTYTYKLSEVNDNRPGVTYDPNVHTIQVTVSEKTVFLLGVTFKSYYVSSVTLDGSESGGSSGSGSGTGSQTGTFKVHFKNTQNWENVYMHVWADSNNPLTTWPGTKITQQDTDGYYVTELNVTGTGSYNYVFNNGSGTQTKDITNVPYAPGKEVWFDYETVKDNTADTGSTGTGDASRGANADGSYTLTIPGNAFTNHMTTQLNLQITKTDSVDTSKPLAGAVFTLQGPGAEPPEEVTTGKDGIATFTGIQRNTTYYLRETKAPSNYMTAGPWILVVGDKDATLYPATENQDGTLVKSGETGTPLTVTGTDPKVLSVTVRDISWGYELPATGGAGTTSYTAGGLALIFGAATLLYSHCRRRKEDEASS